YPENIITAHKTTGQYNTLLITRFKDTTELNTFLENITKEENINKTYTQLILN
ncbi:MAG: Lrp/AsnC family transcriptional regulator, partial [Methanosphaera stadtmanae]|nr:Lrp/AsnC family transcriptional regulator [Methanosphaera stadtmanae]